MPYSLAPRVFVVIGGRVRPAALRKAEIGFRAGDELPPALLRLQVWIEAVEVAVRRPVRVLVQVHVRLLRRAAGLAMVARLAGRDDVFPIVTAAPVTRKHVVQRQVSRLLAAVLAGATFSPPH